MVGHIMRLAAYLSASRHGIYYFRWPIPADLHPARKRTHVKVSLGTRSPAFARNLSRLLVVAGQSRLGHASVRVMRYDEIREHVRAHFLGLLAQAKESIGAGGQIAEGRLDALAAAQGFAEGGPADWAGSVHPKGADGLVHDFCERHGLREDDLTPENRVSLVDELRKGHLSYANAVTSYSSSLDKLDLAEDQGSAQGPTVAPVAQHVGYQEVLDRYFAEIDRVGAHEAKTLSEKRDALKLLGEVTGRKPTAEMTKADAQKVKAVLLRLPKNRSKSPLTRGKPLAEMLEVKGVEVISARTANAYISAMQTFFKWAENNGYAEKNLFTGMRFAAAKKQKGEKRSAFSADQLRMMYRHLTENPEGLVRKHEHKWGTLIGMFTGMRLNEVAQLEVDDIKCIDGVWCIEVTGYGDDNKRLKNEASERRVPIHDRLLAIGLLDFIYAQRGRHARLFPSLTYSAQNGYGRNIGRWFNELLPDPWTVSGVS
jgi:integrase